MTLINNIPNIPGVSAGNSLSGQGASLFPQGGLSGFMNLILAPGTGQQLLTGEANLQLIAAKIAGALNLDPTDPAALQKILQQLKMQASVSADATLKVDGIKSTLTSDLTASLATDAQAADGANMDQLAAMMNQLEPGTGLITDSSSTLDQGILDKLTDLFQQASGGLAQMTPDALAKIAQDLRKFLQEQNIDSKTADKYMAALSRSLNVKLDTPAVKDVTLPTQMPAGSKKADAALKTDAKAESIDVAIAEKIAPTPTPSAQSSQKTTASSSLAMIHAMAQNQEGSGFGSDKGSQGFMQSNNMNGDISAYMKASSDIGGASFVNHLSAARGGMSAQTTQMIALQIQQNASAKVTTFTMQLEPADLGRLDIRMKFEKDGSMKAHMTADRPETLSMLQRDQQQLNRVLQQAGIDVDENSLSFDLRQQNQQQDLNGSGNNGNRTGYNNAPRINDGAIDNALQAKIAIEAAGYITRTGVNIMV